MYLRTLLSFIAFALLLAVPAAAQREGAMLIRGARVFDGSGRPAKVQDVLVRGERIAAVGRTLRAPPGTRIVDGAGMTLIPGLHDLHVHTRDEVYESADGMVRGLAPYFAHGVTSINEYSVAGPELASIRAIRAKVAAPHLNFAIRMGVPGGHGTESAGTSSITLQVTNPDEARSTMQGALRYKPDLIKVFADGWRYGDVDRRDRANIDVPTLSAIVEAAHRAGIPVVTHTVSRIGAWTAARAKVDALVHGIGDGALDPATIALMKRAGTAYVPTLTVYEPQTNRIFLPAEWAKLPSGVQAREERRRNAAQTAEPYEVRRWAFLKDNLRLLKAAGVPIGVGTDTGISGIYQGSATLREIRLLVDFGLTPAEALASATSVSAAIMHQQKRHGRIARGQRADLVLIGGRPDERIADLYDVRRVFVSGREVFVPAS